MSFFFKNPPLFADNINGESFSATPPVFGGGTGGFASEVLPPGGLDYIISALGAGLEFDPVNTIGVSSFKIDATHVMCFWTGPDSDGFCQIFEIDTATGDITALGAALEFDANQAFQLSSLLIDATHVMCFWQGTDNDGFCQIFEIDTATGDITALGAGLEFDATNAIYNSAFLIDATHVINFWSGVGSDGFCQIFEIDTATGDITALGVGLEFDADIASFISAFKIDATHVMCFWAGTGADGFCQIFEIDTATGDITALGAAMEFDADIARYNSAFLIDATHVMCFWAGTDTDGFCQIFEIDTATGDITALGAPIEFDNDNNVVNSAFKIDATHVMCFWRGTDVDGFCQVFEINTATGDITPLDSPFEFDNENNISNSAFLLDETHIMNFWGGVDSDGFCQIFEIT